MFSHCPSNRVSPGVHTATFHVPICVHCLWSCPWAPLKRIWLPLLCTLYSGVCTYWWLLSPRKSFPGWIVSALSLSSKERCSNPIIILVALRWTPPICLYLPWTRKLRTGPSAWGVALPVLSREKNHLATLILLRQPRTLVISFATRACFWLTIN